MSIGKTKQKSHCEKKLARLCSTLASSTQQATIVNSILTVALHLQVTTHAVSTVVFAVDDSTAVV